MCVPIPLGDKVHNFGLHVRLGGKIGHSEPLTLQNTEPLLDLIHPRAMRGCEVESEAWVSL